MLEKVMFMASTNKIIILPIEPLYIPWDQSQDSVSGGAYHQASFDTLKYHVDNLFNIINNFNAHNNLNNNIERVTVRMNTRMFPSFCKNLPEGWINGSFNFQNRNYNNIEICAGVVTLSDMLYHGHIKLTKANDASTLSINWTKIC